MTVKEFFKSTAFKCIAVLMSVLLISGVLLAVCWGFLEVTDEERFNRKIGSVYGGDKVTAQVQDLKDVNTKVGNATISSMWYIVEKNDYLVQAYSRGNGGNVTCWITVNMEEDKTTVKGIGKVLFYSTDDAAEYVGNIGQSVYDKFPVEYTDGKQFTYGDKNSSEYINTGASYTLTAICNDVNAAVEFVKAYASGEQIADPLKGYEFREHIAAETKFEVEGQKVVYHIVTKDWTYNPFKIDITVEPTGTDGAAKITAYTIVQNGSSPKYEGNPTDYSTLMSPTALNLNGKTLDEIKGYLDAKNDTSVLKTGATNSNSACYEAAAFALANYAKAISDGGNK